MMRTQRLASTCGVVAATAQRVIPRASLRLSIVLFALLLPLATPAQTRAPSPQRLDESPPFASVADGVFTAEQAKRGEQIFQRVCSACHTLAEHSGRKFETKWSGVSVGEVFDLISNTMPDGNPGSLDPGEYVSVIAYFLKETGYPVGPKELPAESAALMKVRIEPLARK